MKIKEVMELTKERPIAEIAKNELEIGEKTARQALQRAGAYAIVGQAGWQFDENHNPENLEKSIYHFADLVKKEKEDFLRGAANVQTYQLNNNPMPIARKRFSFDLDVRLMKELKLRCVEKDEKLYEVVEKSIRDYLDADAEDGRAL